LTTLTRRGIDKQWLRKGEVQGGPKEAKGVLIESNAANVASRFLGIKPSRELEPSLQSRDNYTEN